MKSLVKFLKIAQSIGSINFKNKSSKLIKNGSLPEFQFKDKPFSKSSEALLVLINGEENEFLFI